MKNKREQFMKSVLELSVNSGKINENAKYILYSEDSTEYKRKKIQLTKEELKKIIKNVKDIAKSLELSVDEILDVD